MSTRAADAERYAMSLHKHLRLVRALADGEDAFFRRLAHEGSIDGSAFEDFLRHEKLLAWMAPVASSRRAPEALPASLGDSLLEAGRRSALRVPALVSQCAEVTAALEAGEIRTLVYKGLVHGRCFYGDPRRRQQGDLDLMVPRARVPAAVRALGGQGYDVRFDGSSGEPMPARVARMLRKPLLQKGADACTLRRGTREKLDLHWCIRMRYLPQMSEGRLWEGRRAVEVEGLHVLTFSEEDTLLALLLMIAEKLRRAVLQQKLFLDLLLASRSLGDGFDWETFLLGRRREGLERLATNVLAVFLDLWECSDELPGLADAVTRRRRLLALANRDEVDSLVARDRKDRRNRAWFDRIHGRRPPADLWSQLSGGRSSSLRFGKRAPHTIPPGA